MRESMFSLCQRENGRRKWRASAVTLPALALLALAVAGPLGPRGAQAESPAPPAAQYVIQISVDGLGTAWLEPLLKAGDLPNFERLEREGAWTHNAAPTTT